MARIRTIKPEFWTDETIVQLPFEARLLFIGLWNFADDQGALEESTDRISLQVFPRDATINVSELIDLLVVANLLDRLQDETGRRVIQVRNWHKHQKVDNPSKSRVLDESYRKLAIPIEARRAVAMKYGCAPGEQKEAACYFCGFVGGIHWFKRFDGKPSGWVVFPDLELDHLDPEGKGGATTADNLVLSCRPCNRGRRDKSALPWIASRYFASPIETKTLASQIESSPSEGIKDQGSGIKEGKGRDSARSDDYGEFEQVKIRYPAMAGAPKWLLAQKAMANRIEQGATWQQLREGAERYARYCDATGTTGTQYVKGPEKFFSDVDQPWAQSWDLPKPAGKPNGMPQRTTPPTDDEVAEARRKAAADNAANQAELTEKIAALAAKKKLP